MGSCTELIWVKAAPPQRVGIPLREGASSRERVTLRIKTHEAKETNALTAFVKKNYLLSYDVTDFPHEETTKHIKLPEWNSAVKIEEYPWGVLGVYCSKTQDNDQREIMTI